MTPTTQQAKSPLTDDGRELTLAAANIIYDPKGVEMIKSALDNTKNKEAVVGAVAMAAATILHKMDDRLQQLPEEGVWGKMGVVHSVLGTIFEVAKHLGYNMPASSLKPAYEMVENMLESGREQESPEEDAQEMGGEPGETQQPMMQQQPGLMGAMPGGMQ